MTVVALVVTYNRKELLKECLAALHAQTRVPDKIVVIDNASTDGTSMLFGNEGELSSPDVIYRRMNMNSGGSGGFYKGIELCRNLGDWVWLMDDDCIPEPSCLEGLLDAVEELGDERFSFLASQVVGPDGEAMNLPTVDMTPSENGYPYWYIHLADSMIRIKTATFVSVMLRSEASRAVGLPIPWYFLWGDDTEYTLRLTRDFGPGYFVGKSVVLHKRNNARQLSVWTESNPNRINMYFYFVRNQLFNTREYQGKRAVRKLLLRYFFSCGKHLLQPGLSCKATRISTVNRGIWAYLTKNYDKEIASKLSFVGGGEDDF